MSFCLCLTFQHLKLTDIFRKWASPSPDVAPDKIQMTIFDVILLLCVDEANLSPEKKKEIENVQLKYILMLQRYLQDKYPKQANVKLANGLMLLQLAKELYQMHSQRLPFWSCQTLNSLVKFQRYLQDKYPKQANIKLANASAHKRTVSDSFTKTAFLKIFHSWSISWCCRNIYKTNNIPKKPILNWSLP